MQTAVAFALLAGLACAQAADITVVWEKPSSGSITPLTITTNDTVDFEMSGSHNLYMVGQASYDSCISQTTQSELANGQSFSFHPTTTGDFYFISEVSGDCQAGLKLQVTVDNDKAAAAPTPVPAPAPAPAVATVLAPHASPVAAPTKAPTTSTPTLTTPTTATAPVASVQSTPKSAAAARSPAVGLAVAALAMLLAMLA